uniref:Polymerase nucleotidyl transferase domain-containing protein n=1 Tax=Kalanchoe fedtschenkoi TaxID=63787 RepID=A0A7N0T4J0_KALFE
MGDQKGWAQPSAIVPNGLLPKDGGPLIRILDPDRWFKAEKRTAELISRIQPNPLSEQRREAVAKYVVKLVTKCFPCKVFPFGSVPLKTYLPDGDIDLTTFSGNRGTQGTWANMVRDMLESEEKNLNAEYHVKEVQYIQAEVKIVKCLVDNIVVDISFNQLGGLCTLCFLEEVDLLINKDHLFKRSIILIKAWCYYESRILGAHHGLISTYALETLVLYIFHVFNNSFAGPLEVLYRFLEFFSNFDWENFCVSLWGPVPIQSLPDVTPQSPRRDSGELLLKKAFLESCHSAYAVVPGALENHGSPFGVKFFNVIDPLRANNNLGRSVSKGNFFRIRSAFAFGARKLARLLDCPHEDIYFEVDQFFLNTWGRHGSGMRPDAPGFYFGGSKSPQTEPLHLHENLKNDSRAGSVRSNISNQEAGPIENSDNPDFPQCGKDTKYMSSPADILACSRDQKGFINMNSISGVNNTISPETGLNTLAGTNKGQKSVMAERLASDGQGKYTLHRTHSSPTLTDAHKEVQSQGKQKLFVETGNTSNAVRKSEKKNSGSEVQNIRPSIEVPSYVGHLPSSRNNRANVDSSLADVTSSSSSDRYQVYSELFVKQGNVVEKKGIKPEEQEIANIPMMFHGFNGAVPIPQVHRSLNSSAGHLPVPLAPFLASMGYVPRNAPGNFSGNPLIEHPRGTNVKLAQGMFSPQMGHYFPTSGHMSDVEDFSNKFNERISLTETNSDVAENDTWMDHDVSSSGGFDLDNGSLDVQAIEDQHKSNSCRIGSSYSASGSGNLIRNNKFFEENKGSLTTESVDSFQYSNYTDNDAPFDGQTANSKNLSASCRSSLRSRTSSESSWDGSSAKTTQTIKEKRGRKIISPDIQSIVYEKCKSAGDNSNLAGDEAYRDRGALSTVRTNIIERHTGLPSVAPLNVSRHQIPGSESTLVNGSDVISFGPMVLGPGQPKSVSDSGAPLTFFPTGPPVPFFTMLPLYNFPSETVSSERTSPLVKEEGLNDSDQGIESAEIHDNSEIVSISGSVRRAPYHASTTEQKIDILNGDFAHHLNNLQYGRLCQVPNQEPLIYPPSAMVPPIYLQGHIPLPGPGRLSANLNHISQYISYGPRVGPVTPFQALSSRPVNPYQQLADEMPRYRSGTGTYLPNPAHTRERPSSGSRKGYNSDRSDHNSDREANWNHNKLRAAGRNHTRSQGEKASTRLDRWAISESRAERSSSSYSRSESYQSPTGRSNPELSGHGNVEYGMYPKSGFHNALSPNGASMSPMMMLYPYDNYRGYGLSADQLEFGTLGQVRQVGSSGANEMARLVEAAQSSGVFEEQIYHSSHAQWASPDQPSSPQLPRRI